MSELIQPQEPVYPGGQLTTWEWYQAEVQVDEALPPFEVTGKSPIIQMQANGCEYQLHWGNTRYYMFGEQFQHMNHIYHTTDSGSVFMFDVPEELSDAIMEKDFPYYFNVIPAKQDFEAYHDYCRGDEPIEDILGRIALGEY